MAKHSWEPQGAAYLDYLKGYVRAAVTVSSTHDSLRTIPVSIYFREPEEFIELEQTALSRCHGKILDIGAGAGSHSLYLQQKGIATTALDPSPLACRTMKRRGIKNIVCTDYFKYREAGYDVLLLLQNGIGFVEHLQGLRRFFAHAEKLLSPDGQILMVSVDVDYGDGTGDLLHATDRPSEVRYRGEVRFQFEYLGRRAARFYWLFIDADTLKTIAFECGWRCELIAEHETGFLVSAQPRTAGRC